MGIDLGFNRQWCLATALCALMAIGATDAQSARVPNFKFDFGPGAVSPGYTQVLPAMTYSTATGFGFEPGADLQGIDRGGGDPLRADLIVGDKPFFFSVAVPEGNYEERGLSFRAVRP